AKFALANKDRKRAVELLEKAVGMEDRLHYGEPPDWFMPVREVLGAVLLEGGEAAAAEKVFRTGLEKTPRNGRCLLGLRESLRARGNDHAARLIDLEFRAAWRDADEKKLRVEDLR
ncbi:MAG: hypothetical protein IT429_09210, partial [Gemmataceae bacterium]|nr:hypothetical protein [Gemmataceae bacterium]